MKTSIMDKRPVIVHFHLFKNAGTSVDKILKNNFEGRWVEIEGPNGRKLETENLVSYIKKNPEVSAISSHTAVVKVPILESVKILPIVFFRHPIDRIRSAYDFERTQDATTPGAIKAKEGDFEHYMNWRLTTQNPWQVSDFHSMRLKDYFDFTPQKRRELFLPRAKEAVDDLPFVGLVDRFGASMSKFESLIKVDFPKFVAENVHENISSSKSQGLNSALEGFRSRIGNQLYEKLLDINREDMMLYDYVKLKYDRNFLKG